MNIQINSINFGQKYPTVKILGITSQTIIDSEGIQGYLGILKQLYPDLPKYTGNRGYKFFIKAVGDKINAKYPEIAKASEEIRRISDSDPYMKTKIFRELIKPITSKFEQEIDIVI